MYVSRRRRRTDAPVLVYLHGGGFRMGSKMLGAHPLLYRLAAEGWVCVSADYRLFRAGYRDQLDDVRAALAWTRANADLRREPAHDLRGRRVLGRPPGRDRRALRAEVSGVIALYGYYGRRRGARRQPTSPHAHITPDAPPFLIIHGALDTLVLAEDARRFADQLHGLPAAVAYAELPGTQHNFDFFHSVRFHAVTDAVVRFAELTLQPRGQDLDVGRPSAGRQG